MARTEKTTEKAKVKFRFIEFELEGANSAVENSVKNLVSALSKNTQSGVANDLPKHSFEIPAVQVHEENADSSELDSSEEGTSIDVRPRKQYVQNPKLLENVNFDVSPTLKEHFSNLDVGEMASKRYLAVADWFKKTQGISEVSIDHIFTCFRHMGWHTPRDVSQPLRQMKTKNQWFKSGAKAGLYAITFLGEDALSKMATTAE